MTPLNYISRPADTDRGFCSYALEGHTMFSGMAAMLATDEVLDAVGAARESVFLRAYNGDAFDGWQTPLEEGDPERLPAAAEAALEPFIEAAESSAASIASEGSLSGSVFWAVSFMDASRDAMVTALMAPPPEEEEPPPADDGPDAPPEDGVGVSWDDDFTDPRVQAELDAEFPDGWRQGRAGDPREETASEWSLLSHKVAGDLDDDALGGPPAPPMNALAAAAAAALEAAVAEAVASAASDAAELAATFAMLADVAGLTPAKLEQAHPEAIGAAISLAHSLPMVTRVLGRAVATWGDAESSRRAGLEIEGVGLARSISDVLGSELAKLRGPMRADALRKILAAQAEGFTRAEYVDGEQGPAVIGVDVSRSMSGQFGDARYGHTARGSIAAAVALVSLIDLDASRRPWRVYTFDRNIRFAAGWDDGPSLYSRLAEIGAECMRPGGWTDIDNACDHAHKAARNLGPEATHLLITDCEDEISPTDFTRGETDCILIGEDAPPETFRSLTALDDQSTIEDAISAAFDSIKGNR